MKLDYVVPLPLPCVCLSLCNGDMDARCGVLGILFFITSFILSFCLIVVLFLLSYDWVIKMLWHLGVFPHNLAIKDEEVETI